MIIIYFIDKDDWKQLSTDRKYSNFLQRPKHTKHLTELQGRGRVFVSGSRTLYLTFTLTQTLTLTSDTPLQGSFYRGTSRESYFFTLYSWAMYSEIGRLTGSTPLCCGLAPAWTRVFVSVRIRLLLMLHWVVRYISSHNCTTPAGRN